MKEKESFRPRMEEIDTLRALAALVVVVAHAAAAYPVQNLPDWAERFRSLPEALELGRFGVMIFFIISGFVILASFESPRVTASSFLLRRFFRLYPAFWVSVAVAATTVAATLSWTEIAANLTMLPSLFGQREAIGVYWTLENEIFFYLLCLPLFLLGGMRDIRVLFWVGVTLGLGGVVWHYLRVSGVFEPPIAFRRVFFFTALMFWGALYRITWKEGRGVPWQSPNFSRLLILGLVVFGGLVLSATKRPGLIAAYLGSLLVFVLWMQYFRPRWTAAAWLGKISYSIYLFHAVLMWWLKDANWDFFGSGGPFFYVVAVLVGTIMVSAVVFYAVEKPCMNFAKRFGGRNEASGQVGSGDFATAVGGQKE